MGNITQFMQQSKGKCVFTFPRRGLNTVQKHAYLNRFPIELQDYFKHNEDYTIYCTSTCTNIAIMYIIIVNWRLKSQNTRKCHGENLHDVTILADHHK